MFALTEIGVVTVTSVSNVVSSVPRSMFEGVKPSSEVVSVAESTPLSTTVVATVPESTVSVVEVTVQAVVAAMTERPEQAASAN